MKLKSKLKALWKKIPLEWKKELTSFLLTLLVALGAAALAFLEADIPFTSASVMAFLGAGIRSGLKMALKALLKL